MSREVAANGGRDDYRAWRAHERAHQALAGPNRGSWRLRELATQVTRWLEKWWSPQEISRRLRLEYPRRSDDVGEPRDDLQDAVRPGQRRAAPRADPVSAHRTGAATPQGRIETRGHIPGMVMISERPAEVEDRAVPGHWEGDLIIGKNGNRGGHPRRAIHPLRDAAAPSRRSLSCPGGCGHAPGDPRLPKELFQTITWDQGKEMHRHADFTVDTGVQIYFCDPHSPWQRGSNENTNGLLRQYMPKGTDLSVFSARGPRPHRPESQRPAPRDPRIHETIREAR